MVIYKNAGLNVAKPLVPCVGTQDQGACKYLRSNSGLAQACCVISNGLDVFFLHAASDGGHDIILTVAIAEQAQLLGQVGGELPTQTGELARNTRAIRCVTGCTGGDIAIGNTPTPDLLGVF